MMHDNDKKPITEEVESLIRTLLGGDEGPARKARRQLEVLFPQEPREQIITALRACLNRMGSNGPIVWQEGRDTCLNLYDFVGMCEKQHIPLPSSGNRAVRNELEQRFGLTECEGMYGIFLRINEEIDVGS